MQKSKDKKKLSSLFIQAIFRQKKSPHENENIYPLVHNIIHTTIFDLFVKIDLINI